MVLRLNKKVSNHTYEGVYRQNEIKIEKAVSNKKTYWYSYIKENDYWKLISTFSSFKEAKEVIKQKIESV